MITPVLQGVGDIVNLVVVGLLVIIILILIATSIKIVKEYERVVVFRLGRLIGAKSVWHYADDGVRRAPQFNRSADDVRVAKKVPLP